VRQIEVDLRNTEIRSPVSGTVVQRNIELGQTVAASLQAPTLFLIADDLRRMEIAANIDETDVGRIKPGQQVMFTVNAYPGRNFQGAVKQVRLGSQSVQNVVIYTTIISVENPRQELLPGMTANLRVETDRREDTVRVSNAALRWRPPSVSAELPAPPERSPDAAPERVDGPGGGGGRGGGGRALTELAERMQAELSLTSDQQKELDAAMSDARAAFGAAIRGEQDQAARRETMRGLRAQLDARLAAMLNPEQREKFEEMRRRMAESRAGGPAGATTQTGRVFVVGANGKPEAVSVRLGVTDGGVTEIVAGLEPGREVIIGGGPRPPEAAVAPAPRQGPRFGF
jgi:HlyD family secretion protein